MAGGGLPQGRVALRQPRAGAPMSGVAEFAPYTAGGSRLALAPIRFGPGPAARPSSSTVAQLDGPFPGGRVQALRLPIDGPHRPRRQLRVRHGVRGASASTSADRRAPARADAAAGLPDRAGDRRPSAGRPGARRRAVQRAGAQRPARQLAAASRGAPAARSSASSSRSNRLGCGSAGPASPILFDAATPAGSFVGRRRSAARSPAPARPIGNVPLLLSDASGRWLRPQRRPQRRRRADGFRPRRQSALLPAARATICTSRWPATGSAPTGTLRHPASGTLGHRGQHRASAVDRRRPRDCSTCPALTFGPKPPARGADAPDRRRDRAGQRHDQRPGPDRLERRGKVTSTGDFSTADLDLAAPFGPVTGMSGTIHFTDLLGLRPPPGQMMTRRVDQPRHPRRERRDPLPAAARPAGARSSAANGRSWAGG